MAKGIIRLADPNCVLLFAGSPHALIAPTVWRYSNSAFVSGLGGWKGTSRLLATGQVEDFDHCRYDPTIAHEVFGAPETDCLSRRILVLGRPAVLGLLASSPNESPIRTMRSVFAHDDDAHLAACHAWHMAEALGLVVTDAA